MLNTKREFGYKRTGIRTKNHQLSIDMKVLVFSSLLTVATTHFLGLPDPLNLFGPKCPK